MSGFMIALISVLHVLTCISLMVAILLQSGKGGGLAGSFGGGTSQTLFGGRGAATFLSRGATILGIVFFLTSLTLGLSSSRPTATGGRSLIQEEARQRARQGADQPAPAPMGGTQTPSTGLGTAPQGTATPPQTATPPATTTQQAPSTQPPATAPTNTTAQPPATQGGTQAPQGNGTP